MPRNLRGRPTVIYVSPKADERVAPILAHYKRRAGHKIVSFNALVMAALERADLRKIAAELYAEKKGRHPRVKKTDTFDESKGVVT